MKKIIAICWKDLLLVLHDRAALLFMFLAPFLLTLGLGAVTGAFSPGNSSGLQDIPVTIVNQDQGSLGQAVIYIFNSPDLNGLFKTSLLSSAGEARKQVDDDQTAAVVLIPAGFSASLLPDPNTWQNGPAAPVEVYTNPARPVSSNLVRSVVSQIVNSLESATVSGKVAIEQMVASGRLAPQDIRQAIPGIASRLEAQANGSGPATLSVNAEAGPAKPKFNPLAYLAPAMAVFFLMYTVTQGGRSILAEREQGTLPRMLATPTRNAQILGGKVLAIFITGLLQVGVLILASSLLFNLHWGDPVGVALLIASVTAAATGWGILLAAFARTPFQVSSVGMAIMLLFGLLGGSFIPLSSFSSAVRLLSRLTPNAWAVEGFTTLGSGGQLADILPPAGALLAMAAGLFLLAVIASYRRWSRGFIK